MSVPKPGSNLFQNTQSLDGSSSNLDKANELVNDEFNNKVPGTKVPSSSLNESEAKQVPVQPKNQTAVQDFKENQNKKIEDKAEDSQTASQNTNLPEDPENLGISNSSDSINKDENESSSGVQNQDNKADSTQGVDIVFSRNNAKNGWDIFCTKFNIGINDDDSITSSRLYSRKFIQCVRDQWPNLKEGERESWQEICDLEASPSYGGSLSIGNNVRIYDDSMPDLSNIELCSSKILSNDLQKKVSDAGCPNEMKHLVAIRNFFFKIAMWIAAKWRGDGNINSSVRSDARGVCEDLNLYLGSGAHVRINNATLIPTCRDGNCTLWAILIAIYGEEFVRDNFEYCRNTLIPYLRHLVAKDLRLRANLSELNAQVNKMGVRYSDGAGVLGMKAEKSLKDMSQEIERNCGFGAAYIEPDRLGPVAQALGCDIAVITNNSSGRIMYLLTKDDDVKTNNNFDETDRKRFIAALQNGHAIYGSNGHMWGLNTSGGVQYTYPAPEKSNTTNQGGVDSANNSNAGNPDQEPGGILDDIPDGFEVISNDPPNDEGQL